MIVALATVYLAALQRTSRFLSSFRGFMSGDWSVETCKTSDKSPFPHWGCKTGISFNLLLDFLDQSERDRQFVYIVDASGVYAPKSRRETKRKSLFEPMLVQAWERLLRTINSTNVNNTNSSRGDDNDGQRWPRLRQNVLEQDGFLFVLRDDDWKRCLNRYWGNRPVPILTTAAPATGCDFSFPVPTYQTIADSQPTKEDWDPIMANWSSVYSDKIRKIVWRGSLTGTAGLISNRFHNARWQLVTMTNLQDENNSATNAYFDVKLGWAPEQYRNASSEIGLAKYQYTDSSGEIRPMAAFQQYYGVLDTDGYSWSSRFGTLLCYSSVTLKVEPAYVDYFHYKADNPLIPWTHFVPIKRDLSDLYENAAWVLDPANAPAVRQIVAAANDWCRNQYNYPAVEKDYLDIWETYVNLLDAGEPFWYREPMQSAKKFMFANTTIYDMVKYPCSIRVQSLEVRNVLLYNRIISLTKILLRKVERLLNHFLVQINECCNDSVFIYPNVPVAPNK